MKLLRYTKHAVALLVVGGVLGAGYATRERWMPLLQSRQSAEAPAEASAGDGNTLPPVRLIVSEQAQQNLGLNAKPVTVGTYWKTIPVPGMVVDRPGQSDRNIVAPATGVVTRVEHFPGDTVKPGEVLFTIRLLSETLHVTQTELFKSNQDIKLAEAQRQRLKASAGAVPEARVIEVDNQISRLEIAATSYRAELLARGLTPEQISGVNQGKFVTEINVTVPARMLSAPGPTTQVTTASAVEPPASSAAASAASTPALPTLEIQELKVDLGQQVQAGQTLCLVSNHQSLAIEGKAFRDETPLLERSVKERWPVEVDFQEDAATSWPALTQSFRIQRLANTIDPVNRTFGFFVPLENQSRLVEDGERSQLLWRFRPGQKVRISVPVERLDKVIVLPSDAVVREGADAFVFTQNVNTFERKPVRVLYAERQSTVLADDGSLLPGMYVVQSAAAQLNRMTKTQSSTVPKGFHIHADGSLHKNEDEGK
ncbi:efflux RND transporter periplasmic adaptor subunit [soil metagenome]